MKYIRKLEFDPYLCDKSHIKPFSKAIRKFKDLRDLNLVIRRLDYMNESNLLKSFMLRLTKIKKIRLELTNIENLNDRGMINIAWMACNLYTIQDCEQVQIGMDHISQFAGMHFAKYGQRMRLCTKFKKILQRASLSTRCDSQNKIGEGALRKFKGCNHFREMDFSVCMPQGWLSMSTEVDESAVVNLKMITTQKNLEKLYLRFCGNPVTLETIQSLSSSLPSLGKLRSFGLDLLNSRVSETEIVIFAQMLPQLKFLERLTLKVLQYPNVSEGCIYYLMSTISKLPNLKHFEIYFRRIIPSSEMVRELVKRIHSFENIECCVSKQSLYFSSKKNTEKF